MDFSTDTVKEPKKITITLNNDYLDIIKHFISFDSKLNEDWIELNEKYINFYYTVYISLHELVIMLKDPAKFGFSSVLPNRLEKEKYLKLLKSLVESNFVKIIIYRIGSIL